MGDQARWCFRESRDVRRLPFEMTVAKLFSRLACLLGTERVAPMTSLGVDPKNDYAFKCVFGSELHTRVLVHLLNAVLDPAPGRRIESVEILNPITEPVVLDDNCRSWTFGPEINPAASSTSRCRWSPTRDCAGDGCTTGPNCTAVNCSRATIRVAAACGFDLLCRRVGVCGDAEYTT